jgi:hypothetical protein
VSFQLLAFLSHKRAQVLFYTVPTELCVLLTFRSGVDGSTRLSGEIKPHGWIIGARHLEITQWTRIIENSPSNDAA